MSQDTFLSTSAAPSGTEGAKAFKPSISAIREHRARQQADRILDQFAERFTEDNFFPEGGDSLLFAMLTQLPQWPADLQITIVDDDGEIAGYLKGNYESVAVRAVVLKLNDDGTYSEPGRVETYPDEPLLRTLCRYITSEAALGVGGSEASNEVSALRAQIAGLVRSEHALLFEALLADTSAVKGDPQIPQPNPFLPLWSLMQDERTPMLAKLQQLTPDLPAERLQVLLRAITLTEVQQSAFLRDGTMPADFVGALASSRAEWTTHRAIDGLVHTRVFDLKTDAMARTSAGRLLKARLGRTLVVNERGDGRYEPSGPDDNTVALWHSGEGHYLRDDRRTEWMSIVGKNTDSFYLTIISVLQPQELNSLGLESDHDVSSLRRLTAGLAIADNGGWFAFDGAANANGGFLPDWFKQASSADKTAWQDAMQAYSQAILEAQAPDYPDVSEYGELEQLRGFAREKLRYRLNVDTGLSLNPDEVFVETRHTSIGAVFPIDTESGWQGATPDVEVTSRYRNLIDLCLENLTFTDFNFLLASRAVDKHKFPISGLSRFYLFDLIRDLNVGASYPKFLHARLLTSTEGQWSQERYAQIMQAQMRVDAMEAKIAGDFLDDGKSPLGQEDRGYKWVKAVLDQPVDSHQRALVEGHRIQVEHFRINGLRLDGVLIIRVASRGSVSPVVVYTPLAPDGKCFRELNQLDDLKPILLNPDYREYVISLAPVEHRTKIRNTLVNNWRTIIVDTRPYAGNFLEEAYEAQVQRVIARVDELTNTTWEKNWEGVWDIIRAIGEVVLVFTPFKVAFPVAALRSLYALSQGVRATADGEREASLYYVEAALLLLDALPGPKSKLRPPRVKDSGLLKLNQKTALSRTPDNMKARLDGVYEVSPEGAPRSFYVVQDGKTYPVRYDREYATWRLIDPRRPDAYYQTPIRFEGGKWHNANVGLLGGGRKAAKVATPGTSGGAGGSDGPKRYTLDTSKLEQDKVFKKADRHIQDKLAKSVQDVKDEFERRGGGKFHGYTPKGETEKVFTLDLTGMPNSTGRGAWRMYLKEKKIQKEVDGKPVMVVEEGVLELYKIVNKH